MPTIILNLPKLITKGDSNIQYVYDATGIKLQKKVSKNGTVVKTTDYVGALVYEGSADKFLNTEEGRVVLKENGLEKEEYQYHLKDHLGNVRVTFTTADREEMTSMYLLTMEPEYASLEGETFSNLETRQMDKLYNKTEGGKASAKLNAIGGKAVGPSMSLEVMPGDTVKMTVHAKYDQIASTKDAVTGIAAIVASAFTPEDATPEMTQLISQAMLKPLGASQVALFAKDNTIPKAYLNYLFFDKRMQYKKGGFQQTCQAEGMVSEAAHGKFEEITLDFAPEEEGYLMVYVANQTAEDIDVFFDQMSVEHTSGPIIRVDDYYPFGMAFNTGTLTGSLTNKYLYNGKELQQELGLDWYDYGARMYDAQLGRWNVIDRMAGKYYSISPYVYSLNNPVVFTDPDGNEVVNPYDKNTQKKEYRAAQKLIFYSQRTDPSLYKKLHEDTDIKVNIYVGDPTHNNMAHHGKTIAHYSYSTQISGIHPSINDNFEVTGGGVVTSNYDYQGNKSTEFNTDKTASEFGLVSVTSIDITINKNDAFKKQVETLGHEFGHTEHSIYNTMEAYIWSIIGDPNLEGHDKHNPSGKAADKAEKNVKDLSLKEWERIAKEFKKAKKDEEDENK